MGSYFFFDMPLTTIRKREREAILPEEMPFIKADKTNRESFPVVMVLKARLIMLVGFPLRPLLDSIYGMEKFIFLNFNALLSKTRVKLVSWIWDLWLLFIFSFPLQTSQCDLFLMILIYLDTWVFQSSWVKTEIISNTPTLPCLLNLSS